MSKAFTDDTCYIYPSSGLIPKKTLHGSHYLLNTISPSHSSRPPQPVHSSHPHSGHPVNLPYFPERLGYISPRMVLNIASSSIFSGIDVSSPTPFSSASIGCVEGKTQQPPFQPSSSSLRSSPPSSDLLVPRHPERLGPTKVHSLRASHYFVSLFEDYAIWIYVHSMHASSDTLPSFKIYQAAAQKCHRSPHQGSP